MHEFLVHTSINARRFVMDHLRERLQRAKGGDGANTVLTTPDFDHSKNWLLKGLAGDGLPSAALSHASDFSPLADSTLRELFTPVPEWDGRPPFRSEAASFCDTAGLFHPVFIVPMVPVYNRKLIAKKDLTGSWTDLLVDGRRVVFPDRNTPISRAVLAYLKREWPDEYRDFRERLTFGGSPVEVIRAVGDGWYDMGVSNVSFALMASQRSVETYTPSEGAVVIPQVMAWSRGAPDELLYMRELLMEEGLQRYLEEQGFWAVADLSPEGCGSATSWKSVWNGWSDFLEGLRALAEEEACVHV